MSDWDAYNSTSVSKPEFSSAVAEYKMLVNQKEAIDQRIEALSYQILDEVSEEPGEHVLKVGEEHVVHIRIPERYQWDQDELKKILDDGNSLPDFVRKTLSVDKRRFDALDDAERKTLLPALTRKPGKPSIKVHEVDQ